MTVNYLLIQLIAVAPVTYIPPGSTADIRLTSNGSHGNGEYCNGVTDAGNQHQSSESDCKGEMKAVSGRTASFIQGDHSQILGMKQEYELIDLPPNAGPLLIFINKRSGVP